MKEKLKFIIGMRIYSSQVWSLNNKIKHKYWDKLTDFEKNLCNVINDKYSEINDSIFQPKNNNEFNSGIETMEIWLNTLTDIYKKYSVKA